jgi:hypothetical protein
LEVGERQADDIDIWPVNRVFQPDWNIRCVIKAFDLLNPRAERSLNVMVDDQHIGNLSGRMKRLPCIGAPPCYNVPIRD